MFLNDLYKSMHLFVYTGFDRAVNSIISRNLPYDQMYLNCKTGVQYFSMEPFVHHRACS